MSLAYECYCDDGDPPTWVSIRDVKHARKPHKCTECRGTIEVGEPYEYVSGLWDDHCTFHTCKLCVELREWATISVPCFCWSYSGLHEAVRDMVQEVAPKVPGFFMEYGRRMIRIRHHKLLP